ncbi:hypothetical protein ABIC83_002626 [Roseateles asaccharophilus]|uniref:hypothetical protein n=1 Tax=Roseateles asaccharophilus TaxID=582607 RepID=UPI003835DB4A
MIDGPDLFASPAPAAVAAVAKPKAKTIDLGKVIHEAWGRANKEHLPETVSALNRLPEALKAVVQTVADRIYQNAFVAVYERAHAAPGGLAALGDSPSVMNSSAKLAAMSAVSYLSMEPWHVSDAADHRRIAAALKDAESLQVASDLLSEVKGVNVFVAATESDDRDSYLKAAKGLMQRQSIRHMVLDAELIEWRPQSDFLEACDAIGIPPGFVGIMDRAHAHEHSYMSTGPVTGVPTIYIDTKGRLLQPSDGGLQPVERDRTPTPSSPAAAPVQQAVARPAGVPAPSSLADRIGALQGRQTFRRRP